MVIDLVPQNSHQPGSVRGPPGKALSCLQRRQERLLHQVFRNERVAYLTDREVEQVISVRRQPIARLSGFHYWPDSIIDSVFHTNRPYCNGRATREQGLEIREIPQKIAGFYPAMRKQQNP
jgi:hypothetical protein